MIAHATRREVLVGLVVVAALAGVLTLMVMAEGGPGYLASHRAIDVDFRDAQGLRPGSTVRIAGIDSGRVVDIDRVEVENTLQARVRIALPARLAKNLRQAVQSTI